MDVTVPVSPLPPSVTDRTSRGACVIPALHHITLSLHLLFISRSLPLLLLSWVFYASLVTVSAQVVQWLHTNQDNLHYNPQGMDICN